MLHVRFTTQQGTRAVTSDCVAFLLKPPANTVGSDQLSSIGLSSCLIYVYVVLYVQETQPASLHLHSQKG